MQRDNFTCQICGCNDKQLHVHHIYYDDDKKPWEYKDSALITLCKDCHEYEHLLSSRGGIMPAINQMQRGGLLMRELEMLLIHAAWKFAGDDDFFNILSQEINIHSTGINKVREDVSNLAKWRKVIRKQS